MSHNKKFNINSLATGAALAMSLASGSLLAADVNPFGMSNLSQGYQLSANEGKCGEGKCGGNKSTSSEGKCGGDKKESNQKAKVVKKKNQRHPKENEVKVSVVVINKPY